MISPRRGSGGGRGSEGQDDPGRAPALVEHGIVGDDAAAVPRERLARVGITSKRAWFELEMSRRMRWPGMKRLLVGSQNRLEMMLMLRARMAVLNKNESTPWMRASLRIRCDVTCTSDTWQVIPITKEK